MGAHVLSNLLDKLRKKDKMLGLPNILSCFFTTSLMNYITQEHDC